MAKQNLPHIKELTKYLKKDKILPVYFLCGEDFYAADDAVEKIAKSVQPFIFSDFDKEIINADKGVNLPEVLDRALAYPFGGGKKLIVVKNFDKIADKKQLAAYVEAPPEFTVLVLTYHDRIADFSKEPFNSLLKHNYVFEAKKPDEQDLIAWVVEQANENNIKINYENAGTLVDIVGTDKLLLDMQLKKMYDYLGDGAEITSDIIQNLASYTKEFSIFDLQDALGKGDKVRALEIGYNLLDRGNDIVYILTMLTKFISIIAQSTEMIKQKINDNEASKKIGISWGYYINCKKANYFFSDERLLRASVSLLEADVQVKTTATDPKTILLTLISRIISD